jgi:microcystin-dependent protein
MLDGKEHMPLYALLGTTFGGDYGKPVFALPQLAPNPDGSRYCLSDWGVFPPREGGYFDSHIGEILMTAANYCPGSSVEADGRELPLHYYDALFSLLGTSFGGRYPVSFRLPDLRKFAPPNIKYCLVLNGAFPPR